MRNILLFILLFLLEPVNAQKLVQQNVEHKGYRLEQGKILREADGERWEAMRTTPSKISMIAWERFHPDRLLAAGRGKVYRSSAGGRYWTVAFISSPTFQPIRLASSTINSHLVYCVGTVTDRNGAPYTQVWRSADDGVNWTCKKITRETVGSTDLDQIDEHTFWVTVHEPVDHKEGGER